MGRPHPLALKPHINLVIALSEVISQAEIAPSQQKPQRPTSYLVKSLRFIQALTAGYNGNTLTN